jgi:hypothetical protein
MKNQRVVAVGQKFRGPAALHQRMIDREQTNTADASRGDVGTDLVG